MPPQQPEKQPDSMPRHVEPMLAALSTLPAQAALWSFEFKWDGVRAILYYDGRRVRLDSRNNLDITHRWPEVAGLSAQLGRPAILDGEVITTGGGAVSFGQLQKRMRLGRAPGAQLQRDVPATLMIFDVLYLDGQNLMDQPYQKRRELLEALALAGPAWQTPPARVGEGALMLRTAADNRLEGIIAKRLDSRYEPGQRSGLWRKIKLVRRQELAIGGWTEEPSARVEGISALLLGYYDDGRLHYAGKTGTGFTDADRVELVRRLRPLRRKSSPFDAPVPVREAFWAEPELVCDVEFREWTSAGSLRHPSFKGLRDDKSARQVVREV